jgi:hypothetical protein
VRGYAKLLLLVFHRYVILGADASAATSILVFQQDQDKVYSEKFFPFKVNLQNNFGIFFLSTIP